MNPSNTPSLFQMTFIPRISECSSNLQAKLSAILGYFEQIAHVHAQELHIGFRHTYPKGLAWIIGQYQVHIQKFPQLDQQCNVATWIEPENGKKDSIRYYQLTDAQNTVMVNAATHWLLFEMKTQQVIHYKDIFPNFPSHDQPLTFPIFAEDGFTQPLGDPRSETIPIRTDDIDLNRHVNHRKYIEWMIPSALIPSFLTAKEVFLDFSFTGQVLPGDVLTLSFQEYTPPTTNIPEKKVQSDRLATHVLYSKKLNKSIFQAKSFWSE
jgi:acyl-ACP thioesterase